MNPEQEWQAQAKRVEDSMRQFDEDLRSLHWRIAKYKSPQKGGGNHAALAIGLSHLAITFATDFVDH